MKKKKNIGFQSKLQPSLMHLKCNHSLEANGIINNLGFIHCEMSVKCHFTEMIQIEQNQWGFKTTTP